MRGARQSASLYCQIIQRNCRADFAEAILHASTLPHTLEPVPVTRRTSMCECSAYLESEGVTSFRFQIS
jgi:hypothetical protein